MTKTLIRKQLMELFSFFWQDKKKKSNRKGASLVLFVLLYILLFVGTISVISWYGADYLCAPLVAVKMDWMYFALMGMFGIALGAFGSVFNTYASLYLAKDNDLLLSMPIKPSRILFVRLIGVYAMGLMYELLVMIPALIKYYIVAKPGIAAVAGSITVTFLISILILILSAVLGWVVAWISSVSRYKSLVTVALSLGFIAAYYYAYAKVAQLIQEIVTSPEQTGGYLEGRFSFPYYMGKAAAGDMAALALIAICILALFVILWFGLAKSYIRIITANKGEVKTVYREKKASSHSAGRALFDKEFRRFIKSPNYMLNCGLGVVLMLVASVALIWKSGAVADIFPVPAQWEGQMALLAAAALAMAVSMNDITAPSVSLEGKSIWICQVLPVSGYQVLAAKLKLHIILTIIPAAVLTGCLLFVLRLSLLYNVLVIVSVISFLFMMAMFGLFLGLRMPNLSWTNEIVPIKQSMNVMIALFGGWAAVLALAGVYYLLADIVNPILYFVMVISLFLAADMVLFYWIRTKGARIFETLTAGD